MVGGSRNEEDEERVRKLKQLAEDSTLALEDDVVVETNISYTALQERLATAMIGLHTMTDEHFGISVVEFMAAG